ncbi:MAG: rhodanese-like domain-containing protein [Thermodesulfobacteriota bacterium]
MSPKSAGQAVKAGYKNIKVMLEGEPAWQKAGYPTYANYGWVCRGNIVLVDLRSAKADAESRIPRSVNMPFKDFMADDLWEDIPTKAPVVLYSDKDKDTLAAMKKLREEGYRKVSLVEGGFRGWKRVGGTLKKGPVNTEVTWVRILGEGEVSVAEFEAALKNPSKAIVLDVRTRDEVAEGKFKTSQHIPLDELCKEMDNFICRIKNVDKGQKIFIHCTTGARAEMAYKELKKRDYNAYFLMAEVECDGNDCSITE